MKSIITTSVDTQTDPGALTLPTPNRPEPLNGPTELSDFLSSEYGLKKITADMCQFSEGAVENMLQKLLAVPSRFYFQKT